MQVDGALQGGSTRPRRRRLNVLLAIVAILVIAAMVALLIWAAPLARSGVGAQDANPHASVGSAVIHDDPWNLPNSNAGSAPIHDDAGHVNRD
jgi:cytoskeletal protein RodZ